MLKKLTNYSIAVNDIQDAIDLYSKMFDLKLMRPISLPSQLGFRTAWLGNGEDEFIELLEPTDSNAALARFLKSRGEGVYLVCFDVDDLTAAVRHVRANGGRITGLPEGEDPGPETKVLWVHPATTKGVFVQLQLPGAA